MTKLPKGVKKVGYQKPIYVINILREDDPFDYPMFYGPDCDKEGFYSGLRNIVTIGIKRNTKDAQHGNWIGIPIKDWEEVKNRVEAIIKKL